MKYKLMIFDIDGTIVGPDHVLSAKTKNILNQLKDKGILLGLASGRSLDQLRNHIESWELEFEFDILIGINGSRLYDGIQKRRYDFFDLKKEWIKEIVEMMAPFNLNCHAYHETYTIYYKNDSRTDLARKNSARKVIVAETIEDMYAQETPKIMYRTSIKDSKYIEEYAKAHCSENYKVVRTQPEVLEFVPKNCSKAYALEYFCNQNHISLDDVVAFGDTSNDNEMLEVSGLGVCLLNGSEDTKAKANVITEKACDEDGVADYIERNLL